MAVCFWGVQQILLCARMAFTGTSAGYPPQALIVPVMRFLSTSQRFAVVPRPAPAAMLNPSRAKTLRNRANMPTRRTFTKLALAALGIHMASSALGQIDTAREQVWATEVAFAKTMAERNLSAFSDFISEEAVFFAGTAPLRGSKQVVAGWTPYFEGDKAPFSWEPDQVEVLASGKLALSTGPVRDPTGRITGRFNSIWRLEAPGRWRVVFDKGSPPSPGPK